MGNDSVIAVSTSLSPSPKLANNDGSMHNAFGSVSLNASAFIANLVNYGTVTQVGTCAAGGNWNQIDCDMIWSTFLLRLCRSNPKDPKSSTTTWRQTPAPPSRASATPWSTGSRRATTPKSTPASATRRRGGRGAGFSSRSRTRRGGAGRRAICGVVGSVCQPIIR